MAVVYWIERNLRGEFVTYSFFAQFIELVPMKMTSLLQ